MRRWRDARRALAGRGARGFSLLELIVVLGISAALASGSWIGLLAGRDGYRLASAARYLAGCLQHARGQAVSRRHNVGLRFRAHASAGWRVYEDGNRNGLRTSDVEQGFDPPVAGDVSLLDLSRGVSFGLPPGVPGLDGGPTHNQDGIQLGGSDWVSFSPTGTATAGTLYLRGAASNVAYAVRILGSTARIRVARWDASRRVWDTP